MPFVGPFSKLGGSVAYLRALSVLLDAIKNLISMALLVVFFIVSITFSFLCSIWEAVLLSVTPSYLKRMEQDGAKSAALLAEMKKDIDRPLSAILTLNTIAHTVGAIVVGAQAGKLFSSSEISIAGFPISAESLIAVIMTLAILFFSEIIPKTIGANNWQKLAPVTARSVRVIMLILTPFVWVSTRLTKLLKKDKERSVFSKQDFAAMAEVIGESGGIEAEDLTLIKNVLHFDELKAQDVMTPRQVMVTAAETQTLQAFYDENIPFSVSRIPVYEGSSDNITGLLLKSDLLEGLIEKNGEQPLTTIRREVLTMLAETPLRKAFEVLNHKNGHLSVVVNEYGSVLGLITLEDVIETLFGLEIMDETDKVSDLQQYARQKWEARAKKIGLIE
jgi:CBS domain containing-hemolysin-like protein